ncbi:MAG TPA: GPW/gp25 family protein [Acidimicrobiales bacterium]|nr:GPW/gp25 family protein [Acidimicrobiales bacterium]
MAEDYIGKGWRYPLGTDASGSIALNSNDQELEQAIRLILTTAPGERPMRPRFGCGIHDFVFAPADANTAGRLSVEVKRALTFWEPRIEVKSVEVSVDQYARNTLYINILYEKKGSYDPRNLVFPFYLIPEEE